MPKLSTQPTPNEGDLTHALYQLNLFHSPDSMWFPTWAKKARVDLFDVPIPSAANYYKRSIGMSKRPIMILSEQSLARLYHCLSTANAKFDALAKDLWEKERILHDEE
jgi:hypothetical protein